MPTEVCPSPSEVVDVEDLKQELEPLSPAERVRRTAELFAVEHFFAETGLPRDDNYVDPTKGRDQKLECGLNTTIYERREGNHV